jgi:hypothetical protein
MAAGVGRAARRRLGVNGGGLRGSSGDPSGMVDLAWAMAHQRGGELHTVARVLTIVDQNSP